MISRYLAVVSLFLTPLGGVAQPAAKPRLDAHGFPLPEGAVARLGSLRFLATEYVSAMALSPDGKLLATRGAKSTISIWDVDTARVVRTIKAPRGLDTGALTWSKNGRLLAAMNQGSGFRVWDAGTGQPHGPGGLRKVEGKERVTGLALAAGDKLLALVIDGRRVELWDVARGTLSHTLDVDREMRARLNEIGAGHDIRHVSLSPLGDRVVWLATPADAANGKSVVLVQDTDTGKLLHVLKGLPPAERVGLADEGETLVLVPPRPARVTEVAAQPAAVVNVADGKVRYHVEHRVAPPPWVSGLNFGEEPVRIVVGRGALRFHDALVTIAAEGLVRWDWKTGKKLDEYTHRMSGLALAANGRRLVVADSNRILVSDGELEPLTRSGSFGTPPSVRFLADGRLQGREDLMRVLPAHLHVWDVRKGTVVETVRIRGYPPDAETNDHTITSGKLMVYTDREKNHVVHDRVTGKRICILDARGLPATEAMLSEDGRRAFLLTPQKGDHLVSWYDARTGKELGRVTLPKGELELDHALETDAEWFAADGSVIGYPKFGYPLGRVDCVQGKLLPPIGFPFNLARFRQGWHYRSAGFDRLYFGFPETINRDERHPIGEFAVWDREGRLLRRFSIPLPKGTYDNAIRLSPDGRVLAVREWDKQILLYETATGRRRGHLQHNSVFDMTISPDGSLLATSNGDTTILLWDLARPRGSKPDLAPPANVKDAEKLWQLLGDADPIEAEAALRALVRAPGSALPLLKERLQPLRGPDSQRLAKLLARLDSANFKEREAANQELQQLDLLALPALLAARKTAAAEQSRRLDDVIAQLKERTQQAIAITTYLRELRALEVLERIGTPEARKQIEAMANGVDGVPTYEAQLILTRLPGPREDRKERP